eukprot:10870846-Ditylum_brightwellii.AAC.1
MAMMMTAEKDTDYAINACKLFNCATNCKNLPTSHKVSLSFFGVGANVSSPPPSNPITFPAPAGPVPMASFA